MPTLHENQAAPAGLRRLSATASFALLASIVVSFLAGSSAPTPLYALYQSRWGFSPITTTVVFAVYALAVLASLLTVGSLSDHVGRRPVVMVALAVQALTMLLFAHASGVADLMAARIVQGLSVGAAVGAVGAGMIDLDRTRGTIANAVAPMVGTATGGLLSGSMVRFLPAPTQLVFYVLCGVFVMQGALVVRMPETVTPRPGALASIRPRLVLPSSLRRAVLVATPLLVAAWALAGFYASLGPQLLRGLLSQGAGAPGSLMLGGVALFALAGSGAVTVLALRDRTARTLMITGAAALVVGVTVMLLAVERASVALFFAGTIVSGGGFGAGFQGAIRGVVSLAAAHVRAGVLSVLFLVSYLAMGLPAVVAGVRMAHGNGLARTATEYGVVVIALALAALAGTVLHRPRQQA